MRGYESAPPTLTAAEAERAEDRGEQVVAEDVTAGDRLAIAGHLFTTLRGTSNLIFANTRTDVEIYADLLRRRCHAARVPNEFVPHHGSLSKELREDAEARLKDKNLPVNAVCTSTLEMGIDIESVASIAQHGGVTPLQAHQVLCQHGPFTRVHPNLFKKLLRALAVEQTDLITQSSDGLLLLGTAGERLVNHYSFYAAFRTDVEYRLLANGRTLGTMPISYPLMPGSLLIFGGRRWKVLTVDDRAKIVELTRSSGGRPPLFASNGGAAVADCVRQEMLNIYRSADVPTYLDANAARLLTEGRTNFTRFGLHDNPILAWGADTLIFPWRGDRIMSTLALALTGNRVEVAPDGVCLTLTGTDRAGAIARLRQLQAAGLPDPLDLASRVSTKIAEKYDDHLTDELLNEAFAARSLDVVGARETLEALVGRAEARCDGPPLDS